MEIHIDFWTRQGSAYIRFGNMNVTTEDTQGSPEQAERANYREQTWDNDVVRSDMDRRHPDRQKPSHVGLV